MFWGGALFRHQAYNKRREKQKAYADVKKGAYIMKKHFKYLATAGLIAALFLSAGCGDDAKDKKPAPEPEKKVENVVVKPQDGKYYRYPDYIKDVTETPKMTPEIVKYIDDFASTLEFHPSYNGKFVNDSR